MAPDDQPSGVLERLLHGFGYLAAHVLFLGAHTPEQVVSRLRLAYRAVGVSISDTASLDGRELTVFRCPYRRLGAGRFGAKWLCHEKLDRVDDGYVTYLARHRNMEYQRPRDCAATGLCDPEACYSVVSGDD
ncbi:hypothetical protein [Halapricum hydrolyticum]|uniref:hypothetical protein n=1 Tax=Halapricum hydrolyticum TaxID=2979991 RepID=UPI0028F73551|nr:hypothetical protein [Halapricum hydrolyticum]